MDGRFWVGTSADTFDAEPTPVDSPARVVIVDTGAPTPTVVDAGCLPGVTATIDRLDTEAPPPPTPSAPTTTVAPTPPPTTSAPSPHGSDDLPGVHREHGHVPGQVVPDGRRSRQRAPRAPIRRIRRRARRYLGPATEQAVRAFQADAGPQVDGLAGPDTWAALNSERPFGADTDGNGTVDPWEVFFGDANESDQWEQVRQARLRDAAA